MHLQRIYFLLLIPIGTLASCNGGNKTRINLLIKQIDSIDKVITAKQSLIATQKARETFLADQKQTIFSYAALLKDSANEVIRGHLFASAYISQFDQSPGAFLKEYIDALNMKERIILFGVHLGLNYYAENHVAEVDSARQQLHYFDAQKENCIQRLNDGAGETRTLDANISLEEDQLADLRSRKTDLNTELTALK